MGGGFSSSSDAMMTETLKQPTAFQYPVFNAGPRTCLGKQMAELEGVFVLVSVLKGWRFELVEPEKVRYRTSMTLPMKEGLKVRVSRRV
jgi:cytochrome P450